MNSATGRTKVLLGVVLRAAQNATGTAITSAIRVPRVAMLIVSQTGSHSSLMYDHFGGTMRSAISAACVGASTTKNQMVLSEISLQQ